MSKKSDVVYGLLIVLLIIILPIVLWVVPSYFEARTYQKLTGKEVTTWDAMWVELRVQSAPKDD